MEAIFIKESSDFFIAADIIKRTEDNFSVVVDDNLWDNFLYFIAGPFLPIEMLVQAKATGATYAKNVNFFTNSKWVKGNPPKETFEQKIIKEAVAKIKEGIGRMQDREDKLVLEDIERKRSGGPFKFTGFLNKIQ